MDDSFKLEPLMGDYQLIGDSQLLRLAEQYLNCQRTDGRYCGLCISGQTISELNAAIVNQIYPISSKIICLIGTNDITRNTPIEEMNLGMDRLIRLLVDQRNVQQLVLLTVPPVPKLASCDSHWKRLKEFNSHIALYASNPYITVFEIHELFLAPRDPTPCHEGDDRDLPKPLRPRSPSKDRLFIHQAESLFPKFPEISSIDNFESNQRSDRVYKSQTECNSIGNSTGHQFQLQRNCEVSSSSQNFRNPRNTALNQHEINFKRQSGLINPTFKDSSSLKREEEPKRETAKLETEKKIVEDMWNVESIIPKTSLPDIPDSHDGLNSPENKGKIDEIISINQESDETQNVPTDKPSVRQSPIGADSPDQKSIKIDSSSTTKPDSHKKTSKSELPKKKLRRNQNLADRSMVAEKNDKVSSPIQNFSTTSNSCLDELELKQNLTPANLLASKSEKAKNHQNKSGTRHPISQKTQVPTSESVFVSEVRSELSMSDSNASDLQKAVKEGKSVEVITLDDRTEKTDSVNSETNSSNSNSKSSRSNPKHRSRFTGISLILNHLNVKKAGAKSEVGIPTSSKKIVGEPMDWDDKRSSITKDKYQSDSSADSYCKDSKISKIDKSSDLIQRKSPTKSKSLNRNQDCNEAASNENSQTTNSLRGARAFRKVPDRTKDSIPESDPSQNEKTENKVLCTEVPIAESEPLSGIEVSQKTQNFTKYDSLVKSEGLNNYLEKKLVEFDSMESPESFYDGQVSKEIHVRENTGPISSVFTLENQISELLHISESNSIISPIPLIYSGANTLSSSVSCQKNEANRWNHPSESNYATNPVVSSESQIRGQLHSSEAKPVANPISSIHSDTNIVLSVQENMVNRWNHPSGSNFATSSGSHYENQSSRQLHSIEINSVVHQVPFYESQDKKIVHPSANTIPNLVNRPDNEASRWNNSGENNCATSRLPRYDNHFSGRNHGNENDAVASSGLSPEKHSGEVFISESSSSNPVLFHHTQSNRSFHFNENNPVPSQIRLMNDSAEINPTVSLPHYYDNQPAQSSKSFNERVYMSRKDLTANPVPFLDNQVDERTRPEINSTANSMLVLDRMKPDTDSIPLYDSQLGRWAYSADSKPTSSQRHFNEAECRRVFTNPNSSAENYPPANFNHDIENTQVKFCHGTPAQEFIDPDKVAICSRFDAQGNKMNYQVEQNPIARSEVFFDEQVDSKMNLGPHDIAERLDPAQHSQIDRRGLSHDQMYPPKSEKIASPNQLYERFSTRDASCFGKLDPQLKYPVGPDCTYATYTKYETVFKNESSYILRTVYSSDGSQLQQETYVQESKILPRALPSCNAYLQQIPMTPDLYQCVNNTANDNSLFSSSISQASSVRQTSYHSNSIFLNNNKPLPSEFQMNSSSEINIKQCHVSPPYVAASASNLSANSPTFHSLSSYSNSSHLRNSNFGVTPASSYAVIEPLSSSAASNNNYVAMPNQTVNDPSGRLIEDSRFRKEIIPSFQSTYGETYERNCSDEESHFESYVSDVSEDSFSSVPSKLLPNKTMVIENSHNRDCLYPAEDPEYVKFCKNRGEAQANLMRLNAYSTSTPDSSHSSDVEFPNSNTQQGILAAGFSKKSDKRFPRDFEEKSARYVERNRQQIFNPQNRNSERISISPELNRQTNRFKNVSDEKTVKYDEHSDESIFRHQVVEYQESAGKPIKEYKGHDHDRTDRTQELVLPIKYQDYPNEHKNKYERAVHEQKVTHREYFNNQSGKYQEYTGNQGMKHLEEYSDGRGFKRQESADEQVLRSRGHFDNQAASRAEYFDGKPQKRINHQVRGKTRFSDEQARCHKQIDKQECFNESHFRNPRKKCSDEQTLRSQESSEREMSPKYQYQEYTTNVRAIKNQGYCDEKAVVQVKSSNERTVSCQEEADEQAVIGVESDRKTGRCQGEVSKQTLRNPKPFNEQGIRHPKLSNQSFYERQHQERADRRSLRNQEYLDERTSNIRRQENIDKQAFRNRKPSDEQARCQNQMYEQGVRHSDGFNKQGYGHGEHFKEQLARGDEHLSEQVAENESRFKKKTARSDKLLNKQISPDKKFLNEVIARDDSKKQIVPDAQHLNEQVIRDDKFNNQTVSGHEHFNKRTARDGKHVKERIGGDGKHPSKQSTNDNETLCKNIAPDGTYMKDEAAKVDEHFTKHSVEDSKCFDKQSAKDNDHFNEQIPRDRKHSYKQSFRDEKHFNNQIVKNEKYSHEELAKHGKHLNQHTGKVDKHFNKHAAKDEKYFNERIGRNNKQSNKQIARDDKHAGKQIGKDDKHSNQEGGKSDKRFKEKIAEDDTNFNKQIPKDNEHANKHVTGDDNHSDTKSANHYKHFDEQIVKDDEQFSKNIAETDVYSNEQIGRYDKHSNKQTAREDKHSRKQNAKKEKEFNRQVTKHDKLSYEQVARDDGHFNTQTAKDAKNLNEQTVKSVKVTEEQIITDQINRDEQSVVDQKIGGVKKTGIKRNKKKAASPQKNSDQQVTGQQKHAAKQAHGHTDKEEGQNFKAPNNQVFELKKNTDEQVVVKHQELVDKKSDKLPKDVDRQIGKPEKDAKHIEIVQKNVNAGTNKNLSNTDDQSFKRPEPIFKHPATQDSRTKSGHGADSLNWRARSRSRSRSRCSSGSQENLFRPSDQHRMSRWGNGSRSRRGSRQRSNSNPRIRSFSADGSRIRSSSLVDSDRAAVYKCYPFSRIRMDNFEMFFNQHQENPRTDMIHLNNKGLGTVFDFIKEKLSK